LPCLLQNMDDIEFTHQLLFTFLKIQMRLELRS